MNITATQLVQLTIPPGPYMRLDDTLSSLEDAEATTAAVFQLINGSYHWEWPSTSLHMRHATIKDHWDAEDLEQGADEEDQEYIERMQKLKAWPLKEAEMHARWMKCALISAHVLDYLQQASDQGQSLSGRRQGITYFLNPKLFYEYTWMCLNQGHGPRSWKKEPEIPGKLETNPRAWYRKNALQIVYTIIGHWHEGANLGSVMSVPNEDDVLQRRPDISVVRAKIKRSEKQGIKNDGSKSPGQSS